MSVTADAVLSTTPVRRESATAGHSEPAQTPQTRFVGDLNPEGMFAEAADSDPAANPTQKAEVGVWLPSLNAASAQSTTSVVSRPSAIIDKVLLPYVKQNCLTCIPPEKDYKHLHKVYRDKIHPIFGLIPDEALDDGDSPAAIVMRQVVCLAAATDPDMKSHLRLATQGNKRLSYQDFSQTLSSSIRAILDTSLISDRTIHIRALCMLSLYAQPSGADEADLPAQLGARAAHHSQTLGLHLFHSSNDSLDTLFCAVWALDRINAATYGRPCVLHEGDIGPGLDDCFRRQAPCFQLFLSVVQWLDKVIELYRPGVIAQSLEAKPFIDLPVLEPMILEANALQVPTPLLGMFKNCSSNTRQHEVLTLNSDYRGLLPRRHYPLMPLIQTRASSTIRIISTTALSKRTTLPGSRANILRHPPGPSKSRPSRPIRPLPSSQRRVPQNATQRPSNVPRPRPQRIQV